MSLARSLLGYREFWAPSALRGLITSDSAFNSGQESPENARTLLIFQTSKQQTWLIASKTRVYCVLDDVRKPDPRLQWSIPKQDATAVVIRSKSEGTGRVDVGRRGRWWLYSKQLFQGTTIEDRVRELIA